MSLALREIRRSLGRFSVLVLSIALLMFLICFQQALQNALLTSFVGGIRHQSAPVLVYNVEAQRALEGSIITPALETRIRSTRGIQAAAKVAEQTFTVRVDGADESDASILGTDDSALVHPTTLTSGRLARETGEAVGSDTDFHVGERVEIVPSAGGTPVVLRIVGVARSIQLGVTPTLFTNLDTYHAAVTATTPRVRQVLPNAIALAPTAGITDAELVSAVNANAPDADALTRSQAADGFPGAQQVHQSFLVIFTLYALVVPLVTGLFFLILTLHKADSLTLLRAIGVDTATLVRSALSQVALVLGLGLALGIAFFYPLSQGKIGGLALTFDTGTVIGWTVALGVLGILSALVSLRRVVRIEPIEATRMGAAR